MASAGTPPVVGGMPATGSRSHIPAANQAPIIPTPCQTGLVGIPTPPGEGRRGQGGGRLGISGALPWAWTYSHVCRGPEQGWRALPGKPRPAPVSRPGAWPKVERGGPKDYSVKCNRVGHLRRELAQRIPALSRNQCEVGLPAAAGYSGPHSVYKRCLGHAGKS